MEDMAEVRQGGPVVGTQTVTLGISEDLRARLEDIAVRTGRSMDDLLLLALSEFAENWQDFLDAQDDFDISEDERRSLRVVGD